MLKGCRAPGELARAPRGLAAGGVSGAPRGDRLPVEKGALEVSGEHAAREAFFLGMAIGGLADGGAAMLGAPSAEVRGADPRVLGDVAGALAEATSVPPRGAALLPRSGPSSWLS